MTGPAAAILGIWALWGISWIAAALWADRASARVAIGQQSRYQGLTLAAWFCLFFHVPPARLGPLAVLLRPVWRLPPAAGWACAVGVAASAAFAWWARLHLGRLWSAAVVAKRDHRIVDSGPYALVRHPIYTALIAGAAVTAIAWATPLALTGAVLFVVGYAAKARVEERFLGERLGNGYAAYRARVPMLVPFAGT